MRVEEVVGREFFEGHGFFVRQVGAPSVGGKRTQSEEPENLLVYNPDMRPREGTLGFFIFATELMRVERALVSLGALALVPGPLGTSSQIGRFVEQVVAKRGGEGLFVSDNPDITGALRLLVLPGFPTVEPHRGNCVKTLRAQGVDGVISFRAMLVDVVGRLEGKPSGTGGFFDVVRLLRGYDLLKDLQLELFDGRK